MLFNVGLKFNSYKSENIKHLNMVLIQFIEGNANKTHYNMGKDIRGFIKS